MRPARRTGGRRRSTIAAVAVIGIGTVLVAAISYALVAADRTRPSSPPAPSTPTTGTASASPTAVSAMPETRSYLDASLPAGPGDPLGPTTLHPLVAVDGRAWAALLDPPTRQTRLYRLSPDGAAFEDTGRIVDDRPDAVADMVWADRHLYVATVVRDRAAGSGVRLSRFSADPRTGFRPDPDFPVQLTDRGVRAMSFARDGTGRLWLAVIRDGGALEIAHSTTNAANWTAPAPVSGAGAMNNDDVVTVVPFASGRLGIVWTERVSNAVRFASRADVDPPDAWSAIESVSANLPLLHDPIAAAAGADGSIVVSVAGDVRVSSASPDAPRLTVARRDADGTWTATVAGRALDRHGPSGILPGATDEIDVLATQQSTGSSWVLKRSRPDRLEFESGPGTPIGAPVGISSLDLGGAHLPAGPSTPDPLVAIGFDSTAHRYVHTVIERAAAGPGPSATPGTSPRPSASPPAPSGSPSGARVDALPFAVIDDTFDAFAPGVTAPNGWQPRSGDPVGRVIVEAAPGHGSVLALRSSAVDNVRACKSFTPVSAGTLTATVLVRLDGLGTSDATITSLRLHSTESVLVRFGSGGTFAYYAGGTKVRTAVAWKRGTWYESTVRVDLAKHAYDWDVALPGASTPLVRATGIAFRDATATSIDSICVQTSAGRADLGLTVDRVAVTR